MHDCERHDTAFQGHEAHAEREASHEPASHVVGDDWELPWRFLHSYQELVQLVDELVAKRRSLALVPLGRVIDFKAGRDA